MTSAALLFGIMDPKPTRGVYGLWIHQFTVLTSLLCAASESACLQCCVYVDGRHLSGHTDGQDAHAARVNDRRHHSRFLQQLLVLSGSRAFLQRLDSHRNFHIFTFRNPHSLQQCTTVHNVLLSDYQITSQHQQHPLYTVLYTVLTHIKCRCRTVPCTHHKRFNSLFSLFFLFLLFLLLYVALHCIILCCTA